MKNLSGGKYKSVLRTHVATLVKPHMTIFSLPYTNYEVERRAKKAICAERDKDTYQSQIKNGPSNCEFNYGNASEFIGSRTFDLIFLDLCGTLSKELFSCLRNAKLKKNGKFIVTLLRAREHANYQYLIGDDRIMGYDHLFRVFGYHIYKTIEYNDTSPMIVLFATQKPVPNIDVCKIT